MRSKSSTVESLPPLVSELTKVLVLGSMPGEVSLRTGEYYAHPRNRFWPVMSALIGLDPASAYSDRRHALMRAGIGLWDVIKRCERSGSLDGSIVAGSEVPNELQELVRRHQEIQAFAFNGDKAFRVFQKHVGRKFEPPEVELIALPSTSPANASWPLPRLIEEWRRIVPFLKLGNTRSNVATR